MLDDNVLPLIRTRTELSRWSAANAFSVGFIGAAVMGALFSVFALLQMPATKVSGGAGHMHMH